MNAGKRPPAAVAGLIPFPTKKLLNFKARLVFKTVSFFHPLVSCPPTPAPCSPACGLTSSGRVFLYCKV